MRRRNQVVVAVVATLSLLLAACGSRLDHETVMRAAASSGAGSEVASGELGAAPGEGLGDGSVNAPGNATGEPGQSDADAPGATASSQRRGQSGSPGGSGGGDGDDGGTEDNASGGPPIVLGTVGAYSGGTAELLAPGARALQAWAAATNADGGINGRQVKVIVRDDGGDPGRSKAAMQQLVEQDKVDAVVAAMAVSETVNAWRGYVEDKGVPVIGGLCGISGWENSPVLFRQCPAQPTLVFGTAKLGATYAEGKALGGLFCTEVNACTTVEKQLFDQGYAKKAGLDPRYRARISLFQTDFTAECMQARDNGVELLWVVADAGVISRVAESCSRQNYNPQFISLAGALNPDTVTKRGLGDMVVGAPVFPFAGISTPAAREFQDTWERHGGESEPNAAAADGWTAANLFEKAANAVKGDISRSSLITALRGLRDERLGGLSVPLNFGPRGTNDVKCIYYMQGSDGKWTAPKGDKTTCW